MAARNRGQSSRKRKRQSAPDSDDEIDDDEEMERLRYKAALKRHGLLLKSTRLAENDDRAEKAPLQQSPPPPEDDVNEEDEGEKGHRVENEGMSDDDDDDDNKGEKGEEEEMDEDEGIGNAEAQETFNDQCAKEEMRRHIPRIATTTGLSAVALEDLLQRNPECKDSFVVTRGMFFFFFLWGVFVPLMINLGIIEFGQSGSLFLLYSSKWL